MHPFDWLTEIFLQSTGTEKFLIFLIFDLTPDNRLQASTCENQWLQDGNAAVHKFMYALDMSTSNIEKHQSWLLCSNQFTSGL